MKTILTYLFPVVLFFLGYSVQGSATAPDSIWISGQLNLDEANSKNGTVLFTVFDEYSPYLSFASETHSSFVINGEFSVSFPAKVERPYITVEFHMEDSKPMCLSVHSQGTYLFRAGDSVHVDLFGHGTHFRGRGAERLNCQAEIFSIVNGAGNLDDFRAGRYALHLADRRAQYDLVRDQKLAVLESCRPLIDCVSYDLLKADILFLQERSLMHYLTNVAAMRPEIAPHIAGFMEDCYSGRKSPLALSSTSPNAYVADFALKQLILEAVLMHGGKLQETHLDFTFEEITKRFSGLLRDKLLIEFLSAYSSRMSVKSIHKYYMQALANVVDSAYRHRLQAWGKINVGETKLSGYILKSMEGESVALESFQGQLVILDFWFVGCVPCKLMDGYLSVIADIYKDEEDVTFVSVNVDSDRERWSTALETGYHRLENKTHLHTGPLGRHHPMINYLGYFSYPQLLVLDKNGGKVNTDIPAPKNVDEFVALLERLR